MRHHSLEHPELKYLVLVVKAFLKSRDLNDPYHGGVSSFTITLLVISYLQMINKHLEAEALKKSKKHGQTGPKKLLLSEHLINFMELYGFKFNY